MDSKIPVEENDVDRLWFKIKPYWHVATFLVTLIIVCAIKYAQVQGYEARIEALENWRMDMTRDMATMKQEIHDIHESIVPEKSYRRGD